MHGAASQDNRYMHVACYATIAGFVCGAGKMLERVSRTVVAALTLAGKLLPWSMRAGRSGGRTQNRATFERGRFLAGPAR
jgi:hypothetical protein